MDERTTDPPAADASAPQPPVPRTGADGKPVYDQEFFLALARMGSDTWNRWQRKSEIPVKFEAVDFREKRNSSISFSGFVFPRDASFVGCRFSNDMGTFGKARFDDVAFYNRADFVGVDLGRDATFARAVFGGVATFTGTTFGHDADFSKAIFVSATDFSASVFGQRVRFSHVEFFGSAIFSGATLGLWGEFVGSTFRGVANFDSMTGEEWRSYINNRTANWEPEQRMRYLLACDELQKSDVVRPDKFLEMTFSEASFYEEASFTNREFKRVSDFRNVSFRQPPSFEGCTGISRIDLYSADVAFHGRLGKIMTKGWATESLVALRLRALRKLADDTRNHDLERDLYIEERKAERGILMAQYWQAGLKSLRRPRVYSHCFGIAVMMVYSLLADYGRAYVRPLIWLALSVPLLWWAYTAVLIPPTDPNKLPDFRRATWAFAISNAVPFVGALTLERDVKLTLLCGDRPIDKEHAQASGQPICVPIPGRRFQLLSLAQSIFSALCIFFAGLALRNYFKLR
jgi:uncharacterized protein YjbI with pentapeptide repeats